MGLRPFKSSVPETPIWFWLLGEGPASSASSVQIVLIAICKWLMGEVSCAEEITLSRGSSAPLALPFKVQYARQTQESELPFPRWPCICQSIKVHSHLVAWLDQVSMCLPVKMSNEIFSCIAVDEDGDVALNTVMLLFQQQAMPYFIYQALCPGAQDKDEIEQYASFVGKKVASRMLLYRSGPWIWVLSVAHFTCILGCSGKSLPDTSHFTKGCGHYSPRLDKHPLKIGSFSNLSRDVVGFGCETCAFITCME